MPKKISIFGSTGSIGKQTLEVIDQFSDKFQIDTLTTNNNIDILFTQIEKFKPNHVIINDENSYYDFKSKYNVDCKVECGRNSLIDYSNSNDCDLIVSSLVGFAGVEPTLNVIKKGIDVALANKETLVSAGSLITSEAKRNKSKIYAIDSEHNAILQCLIGEENKFIEKMILTASGGPFRDLEESKFKNITIEGALNHPNWSMGSKITIDSASMMNKGLELIEAFWLFDISPDKLEVLVHKQSIIHSLVQFIDGSIKAQLGLPDMRVPISFALTYPERNYLDVPRLNLSEIARLDFEEPDFNKFKCLKLAFDVLKHKPEKAVILNAANEIAVDSFLNKSISFIQMSQVIDKMLETIEINNISNLENIIEIDNFTRIESQKFIKQIS